MIPPNFSTIMRRANNVPVTFHGLVMRSNHEHLRLKRFEPRRIRVEELLARIRQDILDEVRSNVCDEVRVDLASDLYNDFDSDDGWLERSNSN